MSIDALLRNLDEDAVKGKKQILKTAQTEAQEILQKARDKALYIKEQKMKEAGLAQDNMAAQKMSQATLLANQHIIESKIRTLEEIYQGAKDKLIEFSKSDQYAEFLKALVQESVRNIQGDIILYAAPQDVDKVKKIVSRQRITEKVFAKDEIQAGIIAASTDGRLQVVNTLEARLSKAIEALDTEIVQILWGVKN